MSGDTLPLTDNSLRGWGLQGFQTGGKPRLEATKIRENRGYRRPEPHISQHPRGLRRPEVQVSSPPGRKGILTHYPAQDGRECPHSQSRVQMAEVPSLTVQFPDGRKCPHSVSSPPEGRKCPHSLFRPPEGRNWPHSSCQVGKDVSHPPVFPGLCQ